MFKRLRESRQRQNESQTRASSPTEDTLETARCIQSLESMTDHTIIHTQEDACMEKSTHPEVCMESSTVDPSYPPVSPIVRPNKRRRLTVLAKEDVVSSATNSYCHVPTKVSITNTST